jgi:hypothetical protein
MNKHNNTLETEKKGFEPLIHYMYVDLANQCFKPLSHFPLFKDS